MYMSDIQIQNQLIAIDICLCFYLSTYVFMSLSIQRDFEELAHEIVEAGRTKVCRIDRQAGDPGES